jgi:hypothetical protein
MDTETNLIAAELMTAQGILRCVLRRIAAVDENLRALSKAGSTMPQTWLRR